MSWYAPYLDESLSYIRRTGVAADAAIVDGEATLVDDLLDAGYRNVAVLDLSDIALEVCRPRLAERAAGVSWLV